MKVTSDRTINMSKDSNYEQQGNYGIGHQEGGEIKDNAKVAGHLEEKNHNQSNKTDINLTVNIDSTVKSNISGTPPNNNQTDKRSFELTIAGELIRGQKANYAQYKNGRRKIEDIVDELRDLGINIELKYVEKGSIKIGLEGHPEDFQKLQELFQSGQLNEILGIPVEDISLVADEDSDKNEEIKNKVKDLLIGKTLSKTTKVTNRNLQRGDSRKYFGGGRLVVKTLVSNSLKTDFRIICIKEGKTMSQVIQELLEDIIETEEDIPRSLKLSVENPVVVKGYVPGELKKQFKVFCTERKIPTNLALRYLISKRVEEKKPQATDLEKDA